jgi:hypothetical protein
MPLVATEFSDIELMFDEKGAFSGILTPEGIEASSVDAALVSGRKVLSTMEDACCSVRRILTSQLGVTLPKGFSVSIGPNDLSIFCSQTCPAERMEEYLVKKRAETASEMSIWLRERPWDTNPMTLRQAGSCNFTFDAGSGALGTDGHFNPTRDIELPSSIDGRRVSSVVSYAFVSYTFLESVLIPESVTSLEPFAFYDKVHLKRVNIPSGVRTLPDGLFARCRSLTAVSLPDGLEEICGEAFYHCSSLDTVYIPQSVRTVGRCAFLNVPHIIYRGNARGFPWGATIGN